MFVHLCAFMWLRACVCKVSQFILTDIHKNYKKPRQQKFLYSQKKDFKMTLFNYIFTCKEFLLAGEDAVDS